MQLAQSQLFPVVAIGASAGGLEATRELLENLPSNTGMAFVVVHHLGERTPSLLPEILARSTPLPVIAVSDRMRAEPDHVYVMPETADLEIEGETLLLVRRSSAGVHMPIDHFFSKLAKSHRAKAIGVVLSGTGSDGAKGLREIGARGGWTFVQDSETAKYSEMPRHAQEAGGIDYVLAPKEIARQLAKLKGTSTRGKRGRAQRKLDTRAENETKLVQPGQTSSREFEIGEDVLADIFFLLRQISGVDFNRYKRGTLLRRIRRRMQMLRLDQLSEYVSILRAQPDEVRTLFGDLLIGVTGFFRDPETFEYLRRDVFPNLVRDAANKGMLRMWVVGASTGQEAYSLAITLLECIKEDLPLRVQIFATDISEENLATARRGVYPADLASGVSSDRLHRFFTPVEDGYQVTKRVRELCVFARHNVITDPPFSRLDFISCRNLMIYFDPILQERVVKLLHYALLPGGLLLVGHSESLSRHASFDLVDRAHHLYAKTRNTSDLPAFGSPPDHRPELVSHSEDSRFSRGSLDLFDVRREAERTLAAAYAPASVLVNDKLEIVSFHGKTGSYFEHAEGFASFSLLQMAREGLGLRLKQALDQAKASMTTIQVEGVRVGTDGHIKTVDVEVRPFLASDQQPYFVVIFRDRPKEAPGQPRGNVTGGVEEQDDELTMLREELELCRIRIASIAEEKESGLEELRAANEEIQSSNEELQSTNEELQTAKEELESINEELTTVNDQLELRNRDLAVAHDFISNLLANIDIPLIMVDSELRIRRFDGAESIFGSRNQDVGRPIIELALKVDVPDLPKLLKEIVHEQTVVGARSDTSLGAGIP